MKNIYAFILFTLLIGQSVSAQTTITYSGGSWSPHAPSASTGADNAIIDEQFAVIADGAILNNLTINSDNSFAINHHTITINGNLTLEDGASIRIKGTGTVTVLGNSIISIDGRSSSSQYSIWSSPFADASIDLYSDFNSVANNPCDAWAYNASTQAFLYDFTSGFSTTCMTNPVTFQAADLITDGTADGKMDLGRGYFLPGHSSNTVTLTNGNQFNSGDINVPIYGSSVAVIGGNDWNLIGNPYPSGISAKKVIATNSGLNVSAIYLYKGRSGSYQTLSASSANTIAPGQGFFIEAPSTTNGYFGDFQFLNSHRSNNSTVFFKTSNTDPSIAFISINGGHDTDQIQIFIHPDCEDGYDYKFDARKLRNDNGLNFASMMEIDPVYGLEPFVFNGLKTFQDKESKVVNLFIETNASADFEIKLDSLMAMPSGMSIILEDNLTSTMTNLRTSTYTVNSSQPDSLEGRFFLHLSYDADVTSVSAITANEVLSIHTAQNNILVKAISQDVQISQVQVFNVVGSRIVTNNIKGFSTAINTESFEAGVYIVKAIDSNGKSFVKRVIVR